MKHRLKIAAALAVPSLLVLMAAACSGNTTESAGVSGDFNVTSVTVNGKQVTCITWADYKKGGLSCDWANAK